MRQMTIRQRRRSKEYSQEKVAEMIGVSVATYKKYERCPAQMRITTLLRLCKALDVDIRAVKLFTGSDDIYIEQD